MSDVLDRTRRAVEELRAALLTVETIAEGSFRLRDASLGLCLYLQMHGGGELDQVLDVQAHDVLDVIIALVLQQLCQHGVVEQLGPDKFAMVAIEDAAMPN